MGAGDGGADGTSTTQDATTVRDGGASVGATAVSAADFAKRYTDAFCRAAVTCCDERGMPIEAGLCDAVESAVRQDLASYFTNSSVIYDPAAAGECFARVGADVAACMAPTRPSCPDVFTGTLGLGERCDSGVECARADGADTACDDSGDTGQSICVVDVGLPASLGEACVGSCEHHDEGGVTCSFVAPFDASSEVPRHCLRGQGARCDGVALICVPLKVTGEQCLSERECTVGLRCEGRTCQQRGTAGETCGSDTGCVDELACIESACAPRVADGQACTPAVACARGSLCRDGVCVALGGAYGRLCRGDFN